MKTRIISLSAVLVSSLWMFSAAAQQTQFEKSVLKVKKEVNRAMPVIARALKPMKELEKAVQKDPGLGSALKKYLSEFDDSRQVNERLRSSGDRRYTGLSEKIEGQIKKISNAGYPLERYLSDAVNVEKQATKDVEYFKKRVEQSRKGTRIVILDSELKQIKEAYQRLPLHENGLPDARRLRAPESLEKRARLAGHYWGLEDFESLGRSLCKQEKAREHLVVQEAALQRFLRDASQSSIRQTVNATEDLAKRLAVITDERARLAELGLSPADMDILTRRVAGSTHTELLEKILKHSGVAGIALILGYSVNQEWQASDRIQAISNTHIAKIRDMNSNLSPLKDASSSQSAR